MKIKIKRKDQRYKKLLKVGEVVDLPDRVADRIITKGCGEVVIEKAKPKSKLKRERKKSKIESTTFEEKEPASEEISNW